MCFVDHKMHGIQTPQNFLIGNFVVVISYLVSIVWYWAGIKERSFLMKEFTRRGFRGITQCHAWEIINSMWGLLIDTS